MTAPLVVGIGGSNRPGSLTERLLRAALDQTEARGASSILFGGAFLAELSIFGAGDAGPDPAGRELCTAVARADAVILASPGYHGGLSGLVKNALDHLENLRTDRRPYLDGRPAGLIVNAAGWQACGTTLVSLRSTVHSLRGWPTPFGATVNSAEPVESAPGVLDERTAGSVRLVADQVMDFVTGRLVVGAESA